MIDKNICKTLLLVLGIGIFSEECYSVRHAMSNQRLNYLCSLCQENDEISQQNFSVIYNTKLYVNDDKEEAKYGGVFYYYPNPQNIHLYESAVCFVYVEYPDTDSPTKTVCELQKIPNGRVRKLGENSIIANFLKNRLTLDDIRNLGPYLGCSY